MGNTKSKPISENVTGEVGFYIDSGTRGRSLGNGLYVSTSGQNPDGGRYSMILPAKTGGTWVVEGEVQGHWEGGTETGEYLACWEDCAIDHDYQDMVILVNGLKPNSP